MVVGLVFFAIMWFLEPAAMRTSVVDERRPAVDTRLPDDEHETASAGMW